MPKKTKKKPKKRKSTRKRIKRRIKKQYGCGEPLHRRILAYLKSLYTRKKKPMEEPPSHNIDDIYPISNFTEVKNFISDNMQLFKKKNESNKEFENRMENADTIEKVIQILLEQYNKALEGTDLHSKLSEQLSMVGYNTKNDNNNKNNLIKRYQLYTFKNIHPKQLQREQTSKHAESETSKEAIVLSKDAESKEAIKDAESKDVNPTIVPSNDAETSNVPQTLEAETSNNAKTSNKQQTGNVTKLIRFYNTGANTGANTGVTKGITKGVTQGATENYNNGTNPMFTTKK
jgi:hypothetical protein